MNSYVEKVIVFVEKIGNYLRGLCIDINTKLG